MNHRKTPDKKQSLQGLNATLWLVWGSLFFSLFILASVPLLIPAPPDFQPAPVAAGAFPPILIILSLATVALIPLLRDTRKKMFFDQAEAGFPDDEAAYRAFFNMSLTTWIFCELIGVFGLILTYMTYNLTISLPFMALAGVLLAIFRPKIQSVGKTKSG